MPGFQFWMDLSRPVSRGSVTLRWADPGQSPSIVFDHLSQRQDLLDLVAAIRLIRDIVSQPAVAPHSKGELSPGPDCTTDADLEAFIRAKLSTSYHLSGTCRTGSGKEPRGQLHRMSASMTVGRYLRACSWSLSFACSDNSAYGVSI